MTDEQEKALVEGVERLSYALQVFAERAGHEIGLATRDELMRLGADVNRQVCAAFPHVIPPPERAKG